MGLLSTWYGVFIVPKESLMELEDCFKLQYFCHIWYMPCGYVIYFPISQCNYRYWSVDIQGVNILVINLHLFKNPGVGGHSPWESILVGWQTPKRGLLRKFDNAVKNNIFICSLKVLKTMLYLPTTVSFMDNMVFLNI